MRALSATDLLTVFEQGALQHPIDRALTLLGCAMPDASRDALATLPIGARDALLLSVRAQTFGDRIAAYAQCPACAEPLEFELLVSDLLAGQKLQSSFTQPDPEQVVLAGYLIRFRLPDSRDLAAVAREADSMDAAHRLLHRCVLSAERDNQQVDARQLPPEVLAAIDARMAGLDPLGEITVGVCCQGCGQVAESVLDIGELLFTEISTRAQRLLREVHTLARAYGWRESDILAMHPARRQRYLELAGQS